MHHVKNPADLLRQSPAEAVANSVYTTVVLTGHAFFLNNLSGSATATGAIAIPVAVRLGRGFPVLLGLGGSGGGSELRLRGLLAGGSAFGVPDIKAKQGFKTKPREMNAKTKK